MNKKPLGQTKVWTGLVPDGAIDNFTNKQNRDLHTSVRQEPDKHV